MAFTAITTPSSLEGAYEYQALRYQYADQYAYTAIASDGGNLQLTVGASAVAAMTVGEFLWVSGLVNWPNLGIAIFEIESLGATTVTVSLVYSASYPSTGNVRRMETQDFIVRTGQSNTDQPYITRTIAMRPDPSGVYSVNPYQEVISRFIFTAPVIGANSQYAYGANYQVYPLSDGAGTDKYALKSNAGTSPGPIIRYNGVVNIVTYLEAGGVTLKTALESDTSAELVSSGDQNQDIEIYVFDCLDYVRTFSVPMDEGFLTYADEDWLTPTFVGQDLTQVTFNFDGEAAGEFTWTLTYDDGADLRIFNFTFQLQNTLDCRASCGGRRFMWWQLSGGWAQYEFNNTLTTDMIGGAGQFRQVSNQISAVRYDRQQNAITLLANYEGEAIYDHLRDMLKALNLFEVIELSDSVENFDLHYLENARGVPKKSNPFIATSNRFSVEVVRGTIEERINEGR